jgi:hypothetical protein
MPARRPARSTGAAEDTAAASLLPNPPPSSSPPPNPSPPDPETILGAFTDAPPGETPRGETWSPLAVLLAAMRLKWQAGDIEGAAKYAQAAAPYLHPRARPEQSPDPARLPDDQLARELARLGGGMAPEEEDPD